MKKAKIGVLSIILTLLLTFCLVGCGEPPPGPGPGPGPDPVPEATVVSAQIVLQPNKTSYYPGEIFSPTGLAVKATLSDGGTKNYFDSEFTEWTHKNEPLTEDVTKIVLTVPGSSITVDVAITVGLPEDLTMTLDTSNLAEYYMNTDTINFTVIVVRISTGGVTTIVEASKWTLLDGDQKIADPSACTLAAGEHTLTVKYLIEESFTVTVYDAAAVINPDHIEAENCAYMLSSGVETNTPYTTKEATAYAQYFLDGTRNNGVKIANGASGTGAVSALASNQNGPNVYFKFGVNIPTEGTYKLFARVQGTGTATIKNLLTVNINGETESGSLKYTPTTSEDTIKAGNQLASYVDTEGKDYQSWINMFWWNMVLIGEYDLVQGENTIRIRMPNGLGGNIDYFEVRESEYTYETQLFSMRTGNRSDLSKNRVYLAEDSKLTDIVMPHELHPAKYTLIYIRLSNGQEVPVLEGMLSTIDYEQMGEQTVIVTCGETTATFKLFIERHEED